MHDERPRVKSHEAMDDATLIKHLNARHMPVAGLTEIREHTVHMPEVLKSWRAWHHREHWRERYGEPPEGFPLPNHIHGKRKESK